MSENHINKIYASVILPIRFRDEILYTIPEELQGEMHPGSRVNVTFAGKKHVAVVKAILNKPADKQQEDKNGKIIKYRDIDSITQFKPVNMKQIAFWEQMADYYLCSVGEIYKATYSLNTLKGELTRSRKKPEEYYHACGPDKILTPQLSESQEHSYKEIIEGFALAHPVLLHGATGSGKTEIYIKLAQECMKKGLNVLYMVPEIAISKQLTSRMKKYFGDKLMVFHSKQTTAEKAFIHKVVTGDYAPEALGSSESDLYNKGAIVLGTRSSLLLPFGNLGLIIVDEEHDMSYKQTEPAPRYNARDSAIMLANIYKADIVLGSATPSFESLFNSIAGRFSKVELTEKYYGGTEPDVEIIDTIWARKSGQMKGNFSQKLINEIKKIVATGGQIFVFRNRRSYSPVVQCTECGEIPRCPHCNVNLSYHKYNNTLRCHYCDYTQKFNGICPSCGNSSLEFKGSGTEKIEEELQQLLPEQVIARYDADVAKSKRKEEAVLKDFANGKIDILVGTQMLSKGFDFKNLKLVAVLQADTITGIQDFRGDERAVQLFSQLMGRTGRRGEKGRFIIQTSQKNHPVFKILKEGAGGNMMGERREYNFAPYVRMVKIIIKHRDKTKLASLVQKASEVMQKLNCIELTGPFEPSVDKVRGEWIECFYIKFKRDRSLHSNKEKLFSAIEKINSSGNIIIDVDPL